MIADKALSGPGIAIPDEAKSPCSENLNSSKIFDKIPASSSTFVNNDSSAEPVDVKESETKPLDLDSFSSVEDLMSLGLDTLKSHLFAMGVKCGGTLHERATRLFSLKGIDRSNYPKNLLAKNFVP